MKKLIMMMGLPRSGKSTEAKRLGHPIVCPNDIRLAMTGKRWYAPIESMIWATARLMVRSLFYSHDVVILDATNMTRKRREEWRSAEWKREFNVVPASIDTCVTRAVADDMEDLIPVIYRMANECENLEDDELDVMVERKSDSIEPTIVLYQGEFDAGK
jgi:predicted kinase